MRSLAGLLLLFLFSDEPLLAQRSRYGTLKGTVIDSLSLKPIEAATVSVFLGKDSSLLGFDITNKKGEFLVSDIPLATSCQLLITYSGHRALTRLCSIPPDSKYYILPPILLSKAYDELEAVIVSARRPPITLKKDTLEYDANAFKTAPNTVVEDLLKQLPGVTIDAQGNITVNGQKVSKITVNGRDFFDTDLRIASKNLPREIVDKIQVADFRSRFDQFAGISSGNPTKVINLVLRKETQNGVFGRAAAGHGSNRRYEVHGNLNYFNGPLQLSGIGYANNINLAGVAGSGVGSGITEFKGGGVNVNNKWGNRLAINASHFFNNSNNVQATDLNQQNILPDTLFLYKATIRAFNNQDEHRFKARIDFDPDSATMMSLNLQYEGQAGTATTSNDIGSKSMSGKPINASANLLTSRSKAHNLGLQLVVGRRLKKPGRVLAGTVDWSYNKRSTMDWNKANTLFYKPDGSSTRDSLNQQNETVGSGYRLSFSLSLTERLSQRFRMNLRYAFTKGEGEQDRQTHRLNPITAQYDQPDSAFINKVRSAHHTHFPLTTLTYGGGKVSVTMGAGLQLVSQQINATRNKKETIQNYTGVLPSMNIVYNYSQAGSIRFGYTGRGQQPAIDQRQTVPDNRNTLHVRLGNPDLRATFFHNLDLSWQQTAPKAAWNAGLQLETLQDQIVYDTWFDSVQYSRPVNIRGNYNLQGTGTFSRTWRMKEGALRLSVSGNGGYSRNNMYVSRVKNTSHSYLLGQNLEVSLDHKQWLMITVGMGLRYIGARYAVQLSQPPANLIKSISVNASVSWPRRVVWGTNWRYTHNSRTAPGFPKGVIGWNGEVNYRFLKQQAGTLRFAVIDILKQNAGIFRTVTPFYIEDSRTQVLQQYFMLSFIYNIKKF